MHKEVDAFVTIFAMHNRRKDNVIRLDADAGLFQPLAPRGGDDRFASIQVPCRDAVLSIPVASVETPQ
jgi:hypothetical protein